MRKAFIEALCEMAEQDERIWLLTGDLGYSVLERFATRFPGRYVNMGVAEQNMTGVAAGLALEGKIVFTYSIANFPIMRCLEQIRNDVCYHNLKVNIVAVGGGFAYGAAGYTHHALEDLAVMRAMPNMTVIAPGDPREVQAAVKAMVAHPGPCYLRLGKGGESIIHPQPPNFELGKAIQLSEGTDVVFISTGGILSEVAKASDILEGLGLKVGIMSMHTLQPIDATSLCAILKRARQIIVVEEHYAAGGLGDAVAKVLSASGLPIPPLSHVCATGSLPMPVGTQDYLRRAHGLDADSLVRLAVAKNPGIK